MMNVHDFPDQFDFQIPSDVNEIKIRRGISKDNILNKIEYFLEFKCVGANETIIKVPIFSKKTNEKHVTQYLWSLGFVQSGKWTDWETFVKPLPFEVI